MLNRFQQVSGPNLSASVSAQALAARNIQAGLGSLSAGLKNIGAKRKASADAAKGLEDQRRLEALALSTVGVDDQAGLNKIAAALGQAGGSPIGGAEFLLGRQDANLERRQGLAALAGTEASTAGTKATTAGTVETTRGKRIGNDAADLALTTAKDQNAFNTSNADAIVRAKLAGLNGNIEESQRILSGIGTGTNGAGLDNVLALLDGSITDLNAGDASRTGVKQNARALTDAAEASRSALVTNRNSENAGVLSNAGARIGNKAAQAELDAFSSKAAEDKAIQAAIDTSLLNGLSPEDILQQTAGNEALSDRVRVASSLGVAGALAENPNTLDITNPIASTDLDAVQQAIAASTGLNQELLTDQGEIASGRRQTSNRRNTSLNILNNADALKAAGGVPRFDKHIQETYPELDISVKEEERLRDVKDRLGLTNEEMASVIDGQSDRVGFIRGALTSKKRNNRFFNIDKIEKRAEKFVKDVDEGTVRADDALQNRKLGTLTAAPAALKSANDNIARIQKQLVRDPNNADLKVQLALAIRKTQEIGGQSTNNIEFFQNLSNEARKLAKP